MAKVHISFSLLYLMFGKMECQPRRAVVGEYGTAMAETRTCYPVQHGAVVGMGVDAYSIDF